MAEAITCPVCYARWAAAELSQACVDGIAAEVRAGMGRGYLDLLGDMRGGWRFCREHAPAQKDGAQ